MRGSFVSSEILGRVARRGVATLCRCLPLYSFSQMRSEAVTSLVECAVSTPFCAVKRTRVDPLVHARRHSLASVHHRSLASPSCLVHRITKFRILLGSFTRDLLLSASSSRPTCFSNWIVWILVESPVTGVIMFGDVVTTERKWN